MRSISFWRRATIVAGVTPLVAFWSIGVAGAAAPRPFSVAGTLNVGGVANFFGGANLRGQSLDFNKGGSVLFDDGQLHIMTDDRLYLNAPERVVTQNDLQVNGRVVVANGGSDTGSGLYDNGDLHVATDNFMYLDAPVMVKTQNDLVVGGGLKVNGSVSLPANSITSAMVQNGVFGNRMINTGLGLTGGGDLTADRTLAVTGNLATLANLTDGAGWLHSNGSNTYTWSTPNKGDVGLGNVDNTSDVNKPVSTAQQAALNLKANLASPTFTGTVTAPVFVGNLTGDVTGNVSGNAGTVTNGVYTTGSYADPSWITSLDGSKITGSIDVGAGTISALTFFGDLVGNADTATTANALVDGALTNAMVSPTAAIAYSKLDIANGDLTIAKTSGLQGTLDSKLPLTGGTMSGNLGLGGNNISGVGTLTATALVGNLTGNVTGDVTGNVSGNAGTVTNGVYTSRTLTAGTGLTGGGTLAADRTFAVTGNLATLYGLADAGGWLHNTGAGVLAWSTPNQTDVGLGNVDNTSDANKPVSTAQQAALDLKANLASPTFTGTVTAPTFAGNLTGDVTGNVSGNAGTVTNGVVTTGAYANPGWITTLSGGKLFGAIDVTGNTVTATNFSGALTGNVTGNVSGNAGTATNGVVTTGSYANPAWITTLAGSKIFGPIDVTGSTVTASGFVGNLTGNADTVTNGVYTNQTYANPAWITSLNGSKITGSIDVGAGSVTATSFFGNLTGNVTGNATTVTNGVYTSGSYANPTWITGLAGSKISGSINVGASTVTAATFNGNLTGDVTGNVNGNVTGGSISSNSTVNFSGASSLRVPTSAGSITGAACGTPGTIQYSVTDDDYFGCKAGVWTSLTL